MQYDKNHYQFKNKDQTIKKLKDFLKNFRSKKYAKDKG